MSLNFMVPPGVIPPSVRDVYAERRGRRTLARVISWVGARLVAFGDGLTLKSQVVCWMSGEESFDSRAKGGFQNDLRSTGKPSFY